MRIAYRLFLIAAVTLATPADAADRSVFIGGFDRVRIQGAFDVRIAQGPPGATLSGDARVIDNVELRVDGTTLSIRNGIGTWGEQPRAATTRPVVVTLTTRNIVTATMIGAGRLTIPRMHAPRVALSVAGTGTIVANDIDAQQANATIVGGGTITLRGRTTDAHLLVNGPATLDAGGLAAGDLTVRVDGPGAVKAQARYTAMVDNLGIGEVIVAGTPKCTVRAAAGGPVTCGTAR